MAGEESGAPQQPLMVKPALKPEPRPAPRRAVERVPVPPPPPAAPRQPPAPHVAETKRLVPGPPPVVAAPPRVPEDVATTSLTDNQWLELGRLAKWPQPRDGSFRKALQTILTEKGLASLDAEPGKCVITEPGLARWNAGRYPRPAR